VPVQQTWYKIKFWLDVLCAPGMPISRYIKIWKETSKIFVSNCLKLKFCTFVCTSTLFIQTSGGRIYRQYAILHFKNESSNITVEICIYRNLFLDNAELYTIKTRNSYNLHPPLSHLTKYQKGVHYVGIRILIHLPNSIKSIANETKEFKKALKRFLLDNSFYSMDEFCNYKV